MPICPNKNLDSWKKLVEDLKARLPKASADDIDAYAHIAFFRNGTGDIPTIADAVELVFKSSTKQLKADAKEAFKAFKTGKRVGEKEGFLAGQMRQGREMAPAIRKLEEQAALSKEFSSKIAEYVDGLVIRGSITNNQAKQITKRALRVGRSERAFNKFMNYVDNIVEDANYQAEIDDIAKMQKSARKIKGILSPIIREFTAISPEDIPANMTTKYKQAIDLLMGKVPNPRLVNEMLPEINAIRESIAQEGELTNVNTEAQAVEALDNIRSRKLDSVESYREQIADINKLKRKLRQLLDDEVIDADFYKEIEEEIGFTQKDFEEKNAEQIAAIKQEYIDLIKEKQDAEVGYKLSEQEELLFEKIKSISEDRLSKMSPEELYVLNEALDVAAEGFFDANKFNEALNAAYASDGIAIAEQFNKARPNTKQEDEIYKRLRINDDVYWEMELGLPINKVGAVYKNLIAPLTRNVTNYITQKNQFLLSKQKVDKAYKLKPVQQEKIGMYAHLLQEYERQFDPKYKNFENVGKRDEFFEKLNDPAKTGAVKDKKKLEQMKEAYAMFPKNEEGKVDIEDLYNDFVNGGTKYLTQEERAYYDLHQDLLNIFSAPNLEFASAIRGKEFNRIANYLPRQEYGAPAVQTAESTITALGGNKRNISIRSPFAEERKAYDITKSGIPSTSFSDLIVGAVEKSIRDAEFTKAIQDMNAKLSKVYENVQPDKVKLVDALVSRIEEGIRKQIGVNATSASSIIVNKLNSARAIEALFNPTRTFIVEFPSGVSSYKLRAGVFNKPFDGVGKNALTNKIKNFSQSPLRVKDYLVSEYSVDQQRVVYPNKIKKLTNELSGFTEKHLNNTVWLPKFKEAFADITGENFVESKFDDVAYRRKYNDAILEASAVADSEIKEIIGPISTFSKRAASDNIFTKIFLGGKQIDTSEPLGQVLTFFGGYPYRDYKSFMKGFREAADSYKAGNGAGESLIKLSKPLGILTGVATYAFLSQLHSAARGYGIALASGNEKDQKYYKELMDEMLNPDKAYDIIPAAFAQIATGRYGADGKLALQALGAITYYGADAAGDEQTKEKVKELVRSVTYTKIPELKNVNSYYGEKDAKAKVLDVISRNVAFLGTIVDRIVDDIGGVDAAWDLVEKYKRGEKLGDKEDAAKALLFIITTTNLVLLNYGLSIPEGKALRNFVKGFIEEERGGSSRGGLKRGRLKSSSSGGSRLKSGGL